MVRNAFDAEDMTQEVFLSAYKKLADFDGNHEKAWLCKIAVNKCLDFLKQSGRRSIPTEESYFLAIPEEALTPEENYLQKESKQWVYALCMKLKSPYKEVAVDHFYYELSVQEIAGRSKKPVKTIQTQVYRSKAMMRKYMERSR